MIPSSPWIWTTHTTRWTYNPRCLEKCYFTYKGMQQYYSKFQLDTRRDSPLLFQQCWNTVDGWEWLVQAGRPLYPSSRLELDLMVGSGSKRVTLGLCGKACLSAVSLLQPLQPPLQLLIQNLRGPTHKGLLQYSPPLSWASTLLL